METLINILYKWLSKIILYFIKLKKKILLFLVQTKWISQIFQYKNYIIFQFKLHKMKFFFMFHQIKNPYFIFFKKTILILSWLLKNSLSIIFTTFFELLKMSLDIFFSLRLFTRRIGPIADSDFLYFPFPDLDGIDTKVTENTLKEFVNNYIKDSRIEKTQIPVNFILTDYVVMLLTLLIGINCYLIGYGILFFLFIGVICIIVYVIDNDPKL